MFPLHERTRRRICRWVFITCGLLPMLAMIGWATAINSGNHFAAVREGLQTQLGLEVHLAAVSYPRPGAMLLEGFELVDRETGETLLRSRLVEVTADENGLTIIGQQPTIEATAADRLWPILDRQLRRRADGKPITLHLAASEITLHWASGSQTLVECNAQLEANDTSNVLKATSRVAGSSAGEPILLRVERTGSGGQPATLVEIDHRATPLPCSMLAALTQCENRLGPLSTMQGTIQAGTAPGGWHAQFAGEIYSVDLHSVVSSQFPHRLDGKAQLKIKQSTVHAGRLEKVDGELTAGPGRVGQSLLESAAAWLGLQRGVMDGDGTGVMAYERLCANFSIAGKGLVIHGTCGDRQSGVIMTAQGGDLLRDSARGPVPVPVVALVRALVPDSQVQVPATRQSDWLLQLLPLPDVLPRNPNAAPQARILDRFKTQ